jgi:hypothetical protein
MPCYSADDTDQSIACAPCRGGNKPDVFFDVAGTGVTFKVAAGQRRPVRALCPHDRSSAIVQPRDECVRLAGPNSGWGFCQLQTCFQNPLTIDGVTSAEVGRAGARRRVSKAARGMPHIRAATATDANPERTIRTAYSNSISITLSLRMFDSRFSFAKLGQRVRTQLASFAYRSRFAVRTLLSTTR